MRPNCRGFFRCSPEALHHAFGLPDNVEVCHVDWDHADMGGGLKIFLVGEGLPVCAEACVPREVEAICTVDGNKRSVRFEEIDK